MWEVVYSRYNLLFLEGGLGGWLKRFAGSCGCPRFRRGLGLEALVTLFGALKGDLTFLAVFVVAVAVPVPVPVAVPVSVFSAVAVAVLPLVPVPITVPVPVSYVVGRASLAEVALTASFAIARTDAWLKYRAVIGETLPKPNCLGT